jgi:anti-anti-sigma regulatory factor
MHAATVRRLSHAGVFMYDVVQPHVVSPEGTLLESAVHQGVTIAKVSIAAIKDRQAAVLQEALMTLVADRHGRLALDCSNLKTFTCAWINALLNVTKACRAADWDLAIFGLTGPARDILRATQLDRRMTICVTRAAALEALGIEQPSNWELLFEQYNAAAAA